MKELKFIFLIGIIGFPSFILKSQELLNITYEVSVELNLDNITIHGVNVRDTNLAQSFSAMKDNKFYYELFLNHEESSFYPTEKINNDQPAEPGAIIIKINPGGNNIYKDLKSQLIFEEKNLSNKKIIVSDTLKNYSWTLTNETKTVLGYEVRKAISYIDSAKVYTAWYAPELPYKDGPFVYWGLPGLILELEISDEKGSYEKSSFLAIEIKNSNKRNAIKKPRKGNLMTDVEYRELVNDYMEKEKNLIFDGVDISE